MMRGWVGRWGPVLLYGALIFYVSSLSGESSAFGPGSSSWTSLVHALEFAGLSWLLGRALHGRRGAWAWAGLGSLLYAATDEFHQLLVPGRTASVLDWAMDGLGILGMQLLLGGRRYYKKK